MKIGPIDFGTTGLPEKDQQTLVVLGSAIVFSMLGGDLRRAAWLKDCPPVNPKVNGPWRGKGSFGHAPFGPQVRHK